MSSELIGRGDDLSALLALLAAERRLVTVTGSAGIGKTRLAHELGRIFRAQNPASAVAWCELGEASGRDAIADAVARAIGAGRDAEHPGDAVAALGHALRAQGPMLLVLDELERVTAAASGPVASWLEAAPETQIVVTSREPLGLGVETVYVLGPLANGVELFVAAARRARPDYAPNEAELGFIREIVLELDNNPLALELAAPRIAVMGARALLHRLKSRFEVLRRGGGRHGSLEAAIDASWLALAPDEQSALAQASVFVGSFSLEAAEAVIELSSPVLDAIQALRQKSLIEARERGSEVRLSLARSIREFAAQKLSREEQRATERRHADYFGAISEPADLLAERENVVAVAERVLQMRGIDAHSAANALRALLALEPLLTAGAPIEAYVALVSPVVEATAGSRADPRLIARALLLRGSLRVRAGQIRAGSDDLVRVLGVARSLADDSILARALHALGKALLARGERALAREHFEQAEAQFRKLGDTREAARAAASLALAIAGSGDRQTASALLERAAAAQRLAGNQLAEGEDLRRLIELRLDLGDLDAAERELAHSDALSRGLGDRAGAAWTEFLRGALLHLKGELEAARAAYASSCADLARLGLRGAEAAALAQLSVLARSEGKLAEAHALLEQAEGALGDGAEAMLAAMLSIQRLALDTDVGAPGAAELEPPSEPELGALVELERARASGECPAALARARELAANSFRLRLMLTATEAALARRPVAPPPARDALVVEQRGQWFRPPHGERVALDRRRPLALVLARLAEERLKSPGRALGWDVLLAAGWPGERVLADAAAHRVRVAVSTLRKLGLRELLVTTPEGYLLQPDVPFEAV